MVQMEKSSFVLASIDTAIALFYVVLAVAIVYAVYRLAKWLYGLYVDFTTPGGQTEANFVNMFTPHDGPNGTVLPKDIPLKSADPVDWLFMDHDASAPT